MAHYAYINDENIVTSVITGPDEGSEPEGVTSWEEYFSSKGKGRALRTSYNTYGNKHLNGGQAFRGNFAGKGWRYDETLDAFIPPKPYGSWLLNEKTFLWQAPVPKPDDGNFYYWNEESGEWLIPYDGEEEAAPVT